MTRKSQLPRLANDAGARTTVLHGDEYGGPPQFGPVTFADLAPEVQKLFGGNSGSLTVEEVDGSPSGPVTKIVFPNGTLSIVGSTATFTPAGGGGLTPIADKTILANISGASAVPIGNTLSALLDSILGSTQGQLITRNAGTWTVLGPSTGGKVLTENGPGANLSWSAPAAANVLVLAQCRLTLVSGDPVPNTDQIGKTTIYLTPFKGNSLTLWDGSAWTTYSFSEITLPLGTLVTATNYDIFAYQVAGVVTLEMVAWRNSGQAATSTFGTPVTINSTAHGCSTGDEGYVSQMQSANPGANGKWIITLTSANSLTLNGSTGTTNGSDGFFSARVGANRPTLQDGRYCKASDKTRLYIGTFRTTSATTTEMSFGGLSTSVGGKAFVWNYYNRVPAHLFVFDSTSSWSYTTATWRQARATAGNRVEYVCGITEDSYSATVTAMLNVTSGGSTFPFVGIGINSTTSPVGARAGLLHNVNSSFNNIIAPIGCNAVAKQPYGYCALNWMEAGNGGSGTCDFVGGQLGAVSALTAVIHA